MNLTYRSEIDGLRAIAVLVVLLFHVGFSTFNGGYVGVDIFFVISGFLITRLLVDELNQSGKIDFRAFYLRRLRRLIPALLFTLLITTIIASITFTAHRLKSYGGSLFYAVISASNVFFYSESGYFNSDSDLKPLLHTWSLGVEEQFYLFWPLLVLAIGVRRRFAILMFLTFGILSYAGSMIFLETYPSAVFFLTPFRVVEFSIGSILVWIENYKPSHSMIVNSLLVLGLTLIFIPVLFYSDATPFPGTAVLVPCLGTALCIQVADRASWAGFLRTKLLVGIGLISYSLYLIHWPVIVFYKLIAHVQKLTLTESLSLLLVSFAAATGMYFFVERPFREMESGIRVFLLGLVFVSVGVCSIGATMWTTNGWSWRPWLTAAITVKEIEEGKDLRFAVRRIICEKKGWENCDRPVDGDVVKALIIGDSHAVDALNAFYDLFPSHDFSMSSLGGCPPHPDITTITPPAHPERAKCFELNKERYDIEYLKKFDYIVINLLFGWYTPEHLRDYLAFLRTNEIQRVFVFGGYYSLNKELPEIINTFGYVRTDIERFMKFKTDDRILKKITDDNRYIFISKQDSFCPDGSCQFFDNAGVPFTYDSHHLSLEFSKKMAWFSHEMIANELRTVPKAILKETLMESIEIIDWGPTRSIQGTIPNQQANGELGIWVKVKSTDSIEDLEVIFDNQPALQTVVQPGLITAAIEPKLLDIKGEKIVVLRHKKDGRQMKIGTFVVAADKPVDN